MEQVRYVSGIFTENDATVAPISPQHVGL